MRVDVEVQMNLAFSAVVVCVVVAVDVTLVVAVDVGVVVKDVVTVEVAVLVTVDVAVVVTVVVVVVVGDVVAVLVAVLVTVVVTVLVPLDVTVDVTVLVTVVVGDVTSQSAKSPCKNASIALFSCSTTASHESSTIKNPPNRHVTPGEDVSVYDSRTSVRSPAVVPHDVKLSLRSKKCESAVPLNPVPS